MAKNHSQREHAVLSASGSSRWLNCTPSAVLEEQFPRGTSQAAQEGTLAHEIADLELQRYTGAVSQKDYKKQLKKLQAHELYQSEMLIHVDTYVTYCAEQYSTAKAAFSGAFMEIETKLDLTSYVPDGFGTLDNLILSESMLEVTDLKYGRGAVSVDDNPQLKLYALGAYEKYSLSYDIQEVKLTIVQPRLGSITSFVLSVEELLAWGETVKPKAAIAFKGEGEQCAGDWCKFCGVAPKCKALAEEAVQVAKLEFKKPHLLTDAEVVTVYTKSGMLAKWLKDVAKYLYSEAMAGKKIEGYKLVEAKAKRAWSDDNEVIDALIIAGFPEAKVVNTKPKGIGDISSLMSVDRFDKVLGHLIDKPRGKPTLVTEADKRPVYKNNSGEDFI